MIFSKNHVFLAIFGCSFMTSASGWPRHPSPHLPPRRSHSALEMGSCKILRAWAHKRTKVGTRTVKKILQKNLPQRASSRCTRFGIPYRFQPKRIATWAPPLLRRSRPVGCRRAGTADVARRRRRFPRERLFFGALLSFGPQVAGTLTSTARDILWKSPRERIARTTRRERTENENFIRLRRRTACLPPKPYSEPYHFSELIADAASGGLRDGLRPH